MCNAWVGDVRGRRARWIAAIVLLAGCGGGPDRVPESTVSGLLASYEAEAYFELRTALDSLTGNDPRVTFLRGVVAHAFNDPARSNEYLARLGEGLASLPDTLRADAAVLRFRNNVRLGEYAAAAAAAGALRSLPAADSATRRDVANEARAMVALSDVPPQRVVARAPSRVNRRPDTRVPIQVGDSVRGYVFDTGAGLSTMMRSEAESLGLRVREAGVEVGTALGSTVTADVAVAPRVRLGAVELENVVFLVVPDAVLTFGPTFRIPGIIGFPVIDALGEVEFVGDSVLRVPGAVPDRRVHNLAMSYLTPLVRVRILGHDAVCELDTGANHTSLHLPFYRAHRREIEAAGRRDSLHVAGAGSQRVIPTWVLPEVRLELADTAAVIAELPVYTETVAREGDEGADCRLGLDALARFRGYLLNFRSMSFLPR